MPGHPQLLDLFTKPACEDTDPSRPGGDADQRRLVFFPQVVNGLVAKYIYL